MAKIKLYFLQASRCIRIAWLLEELGLEYDVEFAPRENNAAPADFKKKAGGLGKFPTLIDGDLVLYESGNIAEYLCDVYDKSHRLLAAPGDPKRYQQLQWLHASEGTFLTHGLAITYVRWNQKSGNVAETEEGLSKNVQKDLDYFVAELQKSDGPFLLGDRLSVADMAMQFSLSFILARKLGTGDKSWPALEQYLRDCEGTASFQQAVKKSGYQL